MRLVAQLRDRFGVEPILRVINVRTSTFYGWLKRAAHPCERAVVDLGLVTEIVEVHDLSGGTYGCPRVHATLRRRGIRVSRKRVERLMRVHGLQGAFLRRKMAGQFDPAGSTGRAGTGPGQPPVHGRRSEPVVGRRRHAYPGR